MKQAPRPSFILARSIAALIAASGTSFAVNNFWTGTTSTDWNDPTNWSEGRVPVNPSPAGFDDAVVNTNTGNIATISANIPTVNDLLVGARASGATGLLNHRAGTVTANGWAFVGVDGNNGTYNLANTTTTGGTLTGLGLGSGTLNVGGRLYVGGTQGAAGGIGTFNMNTTGTLAIGNDLALGTGGGTGLMNVDAGTITTGGWNFIGKADPDGGGTGTLKINGGSLTNGGGRTYVGFNAATGHIEISGTGVYNNPGDWFAVGHNNLGIGTTSTVKISGGGKLTSGLFVSGGSPEAAGVGSTSVDGAAALLQAGELWVGNRSGSRGILTVNAGTVTAGNWIAIGRDSGLGVVNITGGGTLTKTGGNGNHIIIGSIGGTGTVNVVGGTIQTVGGGNILLGENGFGSGTLNVISGGIAQADAFLRGPGGGAPSQIYLDNGTIRAAISNTSFMQGIDNVVVGSGGAVFDTNSKDISIAQTLSAPSGDGVTSIQVTDGGSGYIGQPIVQISGDGTGASAIANVVGGVVTGITITNPGIGYTSAPIVTLYDGGTATPATLGTVTTTTNGSGGGLRKIGNGVLTLSGFNTYLGATVISAGALSVPNIGFGGSGSPLGASSSDAGNLIFDGGTLRYTGAGDTTDRNYSVSAGKTALFEVTQPTATLTLLGGAAVGTTNGLTKTGNGTLSLAGPANYSGTTTINGGILAAVGTYSSPFVVNNTGHLAAQNGAVGTLTVPTLTLGTGSALDFEFGSGNDLITITNANGLTLGNTGLFLYQEGGTTPFTDNGTYTILDYNTSFTGTLNTSFFIANSQVGKVYGLNNNTGNTTLQLTIADAVTAIWNTDGDGLWTTAGNWTGPVPNSIGAIATFGSVLTNPSATISLNGSKTVGSIIFDNPNPYTITGAASDTLSLSNGFGVPSITVVSGSHTIAAKIALTQNSNLVPAVGTTLTISGDISGSGGLAVTDAGDVVLLGNNSYTGTTTVNAGILNVGNGGTIGTLGSGPVLLGSGALTFNRSDNISISHNISGSGVLNFNGTGAVTYTGSSTQTGATNLNSGTFINAGTINGTSSLLVRNTATTLQAGSTTTVAGVATVTNAATITNAGSTFTANRLIATGGSTVNQNSGTLNSTIIEVNGGATINQNGGNLIYNEGYIGNAGSSGVVNLNAGKVTSNRWTVIGDQSGSEGTVNMMGGTWNQNHTDWLSVGQQGKGTFIMSGNSVLNDPADVDTSNRTTGRGNIVVGRWTSAPGGDGKWTITDTATAHIRSLLVGDQSGTVGEVNINGSSVVTSSEDFNIGRAGTGVVNLNGGSLGTTSGWTQIGVDSGSTGTLNVNSGSITSREYRVGVNGNGFVNVAGGTLNANQSISLGIETGGRGTFNVSSGTVNANVGDFLVSDGGLGVMNVSGGTTNVTNRLIVGNGASGTGHVSVTGGTMALNSEMWIGQRNDGGTPGKGLMDVSAGSVTVGNWLAVGREGALGVLNVKGTGTVTKTGGNGSHIIIGSIGGTGVANVMGGTLRTVGGANILLGEGGSGSGILNVTAGGVAQADAILDGPGGGAPNQVYLSGGTLRAATSTANFMQGLDSTIIGPGGGTIDTNGNNITIAQSLDAPSGNGVTTIPILDGGAGYVGQPIVQITGDGFGASAIANIVDGVVISITITNPGINYTTASVILHGGGESIPASLDVPTLGANVATGGLTKTGAGTLTLTADGSYGGATTVNAGTLEFAVSQTLSSLNIGDGATVVLLADGAGALPGLDLGGESEAVNAAAPVQAVPEPGALSLLAIGALSLLRRRRHS